MTKRGIKQDTKKKKKKSVNNKTGTEDKPI